MSSREKLGISSGLALAWALVTCIVYLATLSRAYDFNGIAELKELAKGFGPSMFPPNHMLYRSTLALVVGISRWFGYEGWTLAPAQVLSAISGGATVGLFAMLIQQHLANWTGRHAIIAAFAGSFAVWSFSTDVYYIMLAAAFATAGYVWIGWASRRPFSYIRWLGLSVWLSLSIFFWEAGIFLIFPYAVMTWFWTSKEDKGFRTRAVLTWLIGAGILTSVAYVLGAIWVHRVTSPKEFIMWMTTYPTGQLPIYGVMHLDRLLPTVRSLVSAILPVWGGFVSLSLFHEL